MKKSFIFIFSMYIALIVGCGGDNGAGGGDNGDVYVQGNLKALLSATAPSMTNINDPIWATADSVDVRIGYEEAYGINQNLSNDTLVMKVIKTADRIYIKAQWKDFRRDYKGTHMRRLEYSWEFVTTADGEAGEDGFFILFDGQDNGNEGADCATMCHAVGNSMATTGGGIADIWSWRSATVGPAKLAEDGWIKSNGLFSDPKQFGDRLVYQENWEEILGVFEPKKMHQDGPDYTGEFLFTEPDTLYYNCTSWFDPPDNTICLSWEEVAGPPADSTHIDDLIITYSSLAGWIQGFIMPGYYLDSNVYKDPSPGSQWDVKTISSYSNDQWTVVFERALTTDNSSGAGRHDQDLSGLDSVQVTIAVANRHTDPTIDSQWREHSGSVPFYIVFNRPD
jgi:hypothetical protein